LDTRSKAPKGRAVFFSAQEGARRAAEKEEKKRKAALPKAGRAFLSFSMERTFAPHENRFALGLGEGKTREKPRDQRASACGEVSLGLALGKNDRKGLGLVGVAL
jgi:hypothetical protein